MNGDIQQLLAHRILLDYLRASTVVRERGEPVDFPALKRDKAVFWVTLDTTDHVFVRAMMYSYFGQKFYASQTSPILGKGEQVWNVLEKLTSNPMFSQWRNNQVELKLYELENIEFSVDISDFQAEFEKLSGTRWEGALEEYPFTPPSDPDDEFIEEIY